MDQQQQSNKAHRGGSKKVGAKKKLHNDGQNKKAFAVSAPRKLERMARRSHDVNEKKLHVPMVDRTPDDDPPPIIVAVVGPPGTGKSTLIKSLIRRLTKTTLSEINGPVTVVSGKRRRLTFIEVNNDLNSMIDIAKVADLVLLLIDGNYGLEMETMEFLNIAQHHGMPRVLGVATHLDLFKSQLTLRTSKKRLKHRFWTEVYQGLNCFTYQGSSMVVIRIEILNLSRFISVMKFRPLKWRNEHPYLLGDRITDLTHPQLIAENPKCDRKVAVYGYLHGTPLPSENAHVHIAGVGDYYASSVEKLPDPCPTPYFEQRLEEIEREKLKNASESGSEVAKTTRRRKRLEDKQKIIYAPMSNVGGVLVDKDAVYIDIGKESFKNSGDSNEIQGEGEKLVTDLQEVTKTMAERLEEDSGLQLFSNSKVLNEVEEYESDDDEEDDEDDNEEVVDTGRSTLRKARVYGKSIAEDDEFDGVVSGDEDNDDLSSDDDDANLRVPRTVEVDFGANNKYRENELEYEEDSSLSSDEDYYKSAATKLKGSVQRRWNINKLLYLNTLDPLDVLKKWRNEETDDEEEEDIRKVDDEDDTFFTKKKTLNYHEDLDLSKPSFPSLEVLKAKFDKNNDSSSDDEYENGYKLLKARLLTAPDLNSLNDVEGDENNGGNNGDDDDEELYGDFEDLEAGDNDGDEESENHKPNPILRMKMILLTLKRKSRKTMVLKIQTKSL